MVALDSVLVHARGAQDTEIFCMMNIKALLTGTNHALWLEGCLGHQKVRHRSS